METILNGKTNDAALVERFLTIVNGETDRMITLINDLLDLTKIENRKQKLIFEPVNIRKIFEDTITVLSSKAEQKEIVVENKLDDIIVLSDPKLRVRLALTLLTMRLSTIKKAAVFGSMRLLKMEQPASV